MLAFFLTAISIQVSKKNPAAYMTGQANIELIVEEAFGTEQLSLLSVYVRAVPKKSF
jgi:hypothetical protein